MSTRTRATGSVSAGSHDAAVRRRVAAALAFASSTAARSPGSMSASGASWDVMPEILSARPDSRGGRARRLWKRQMPAAALSLLARSVFSQVKSTSSRPKCP